MAIGKNEDMDGNLGSHSLSFLAKAWFSVVKLNLVFYPNAEDSVRVMCSYASIPSAFSFCSCLSNPENSSFRVRLQ